MAVYQSDLQDIFFNLFDVHKVHEMTDQFEENDLKDILREYDKFIGQEFFPCRETGDQEGVQLTKEGVKVPPSFHAPHKAFYENGWYGLGYSEDIEGIPAPEPIGFAAASIATGSNVSLSMYYGLTKGAMNVILKVGSEEQKKFYIPQMMSGAWGGTMCLTEPGAGSDVGNLKTTATPMEDGKYKMSGVKIFISSGDNDLYDNIIHLVLARTPGADAGTKGLSLFIVPKMKVNSDGSLNGSNDVFCTKVEEKMGIHGQATCELTFGQNGDCEGYLIGKEGEGMQNMFIMMNEARLLCGIQGESQANLCYALTRKYAEERVQFGTEIKNMPDVKRMLLKMRSMSRGLRALNIYAGCLIEKENHGDQSVASELALLTPICKAYASEEGFQVSVDGVQVHGGYGFCSEYGIEQFVRDTKIATIYEGTNGIQAMDFVLRKILKDQGKTFMMIGQKVQKTMQKEIAKEWDHELRMMGKSMEQSENILKKYAAFMAAKNMNGVLSSAYDFLMYCGNIVLSWQLLEQACVAKEKLGSAESDDNKRYYESKIIDFKVFCQQFLVRNLAIAQSILNFDEDLSGLEV